MKKLLLPILALGFGFANAQTPCAGGSAGPYPCSGYNLQSEFSLGDLNAGAGNDSWGWTDPSNGDEYALVGLDNGTAFIDISDPVNPVYLGKLPTHTNSSTWRDIKVYNNYAFVVSEANNHGMQVFDLTRLRNVNNPPITFTEDAHYNGFGSAHNLVINEDTGYAYGVGTGSFNGGPHFVNIQNPLNPVGEGGYSLGSYSHDAQVVTYCGPDADYAGREILIGSNESQVVIVDITDKGNPVGISNISYSNVAYTHQGWFTEDQTYFILGDELDEQNIGFNTRTIIFDFTDLDNPQHHFEYTGPTPAIDHNGYVKGTKYYMANYRAGLRVIDISDIANQNISEEGYFDSYPNNNNANFSGAWSVFPYFASGNIVISDINRGFLLVKAATSDLIEPVANCQDVTIMLDANGNASVTAAQINDGSTDNSGTVYFLLCDDTFDCGDLGANTVQLEVYDDFGNRDYCTATVTVVDDIDPAITCPADFTVGYDSGNPYYTVPNYDTTGVVTATDNCAAGLVITQNPTPGTQLTVGTYTISCEVTDGSGNTNTCTFELTVEEVLGTNDVNLESGLAIYPNPTSNVITISSKHVNLSSVAIMDVLGKQVYTANTIDSETTTIDISGFSKGMYFVKINNSTTKKIIKN
ncbi:MAG: choice-of-anchor B family protein [Altibacter sp.]|uniref:choice-of-anchor B family protein n=1 Tax=Altibacter sp. TaxID=2024823 RepID=UPI001DBF8985|nr:choice-of-anchor B family protein [Altibacter sp.]